VVVVHRRLGDAAVVMLHAQLAVHDLKARSQLSVEITTLVYACSHSKLASSNSRDR
jgi:hypothetical protein